MLPIILSIFPGIDILGQGFEHQGFCVVRGPDSIYGGDIRKFSPPRGSFRGVIGAPPCQDFSALNRYPGNYSYEMLDEYRRVVSSVEPDWFLFENVARAPHFQIAGYTQQRFELDLAWFSDFSRLRHFVFGSLDGSLLNPLRGNSDTIKGTAVTCNDERSFRACCDIQGLSPDFDLPSFSLEGKKRAVGNAVPLPMSRYIAGLISQTLYAKTPVGSKAAWLRRCHPDCGCGRAVVGQSIYASAACRKRGQRKRDSATAINVSQVTYPESHANCPRGVTEKT